MEELKHIFLFLILVTPLVVIVLLVRRNAQRYAEGPFASQRIEGGSDIAETSLESKSDTVANADATNVAIDEKSNLAGDRGHMKHDDTSDHEHDKSENPYSTWMTLLSTYCLFMLCTPLLKKVDPDLAGGAIIIIKFVFCLRLIVMILRTATRKKSHFRWYKVKEGVDYNRWGEFILDPDVSHYDYFELRRMDPTLPKSDPRGPNSFGDTTVLTCMEPYRKWLYFSTDLGSYKKRCEMYYGYGSHDSNKRPRLLKKLDTTLLTDTEKEILDKRRVQASTYFNYIELEEQIESKSNENQFAPSLIALKVRHRAGKILFSEAFTVTLFIVLFIVGLYFFVTKEVL